MTCTSEDGVKPRFHPHRIRCFGAAADYHRVSQLTRSLGGGLEGDVRRYVQSRVQGTLRGRGRLDMGADGGSSSSSSSSSSISSSRSRGGSDKAPAAKKSKPSPQSIAEFLMDPNRLDVDENAPFCLNALHFYEDMTQRTGNNWSIELHDGALCNVPHATTAALLEGGKFTDSKFAPGAPQLTATSARGFAALASVCDTEGIGDDDVEAVVGELFEKACAAFPLVVDSALAAAAADEPGESKLGDAMERVIVVRQRAFAKESISGSVVVTLKAVCKESRRTRARIRKELKALHQPVATRFGFNLNDLFPKTSVDLLQDRLPETFGTGRQNASGHLLCTIDQYTGHAMATHVRLWDAVVTDLEMSATQLGLVLGHHLAHGHMVFPQYLPLMLKDDSCNVDTKGCGGTVSLSNKICDFPTMHADVSNPRLAPSVMYQFGNDVWAIVGSGAQNMMNDFVSILPECFVHAAGAAAGAGAGAGGVEGGVGGGGGDARHVLLCKTDDEDVRVHEHARVLYDEYYPGRVENAKSWLEEHTGEDDISATSEGEALVYSASGAEGGGVNVVKSPPATHLKSKTGGAFGALRTNMQLSFYGNRKDTLAVSFEYMDTKIRFDFDFIDIEKLCYDDDSGELFIRLSRRQTNAPLRFDMYDASSKAWSAATETEVRTAHFNLRKENNAWIRMVVSSPAHKRDAAARIPLFVKYAVQTLGKASCTKADTEVCNCASFYENAIRHGGRCKRKGHITTWNLRAESIPSGLAGEGGVGGGAGKERRRKTTVEFPLLDLPEMGARALDELVERARRLVQPEDAVVGEDEVITGGEGGEASSFETDGCATCAHSTRFVVIRVVGDDGQPFNVSRWVATNGTTADHCLNCTGRYGKNRGACEKMVESATGGSVPLSKLGPGGVAPTVHDEPKMDIERKRLKVRVAKSDAEGLMKATNEHWGADSNVVIKEGEDYYWQPWVVGSGFCFDGKTWATYMYGNGYAQECNLPTDRVTKAMARTISPNMEPLFARPFARHRATADRTVRATGADVCTADEKKAMNTAQNADAPTPALATEPNERAAEWCAWHRFHT